jgi:hypothetical protein
MFTVEIRINSALIAHVYGRNVGETNGVSIYDCEYYEADTRKVRNVTVRHKRDDGIRRLVRTILEKVDE